MADRRDLLSRRQAMGLFAGLGAGVVAVACSGGSSSKGASSSTRTTSAGASGTTASSAACVLTPEATEGPYYLDLDKVRRNVTEGRAGLRLDLRIKVVNASTCKPLGDVAVEIWHADAGGTYSGFSQEGTAGKTTCAARR